MSSPSSSLRYADKIVLVTGGSSGIGKASVAQFVKEGATVIIADFNPNEEFLKEVKAQSPKSIFVKTDVTKKESVDALFKTIAETFGGRLDVAFNSAGVEAHRPIHENTEEDYHYIIDTNVKGTFLCLQHEIRLMLAQGKGNILNAGSVGGTVTAPGLSLYCASKAAVESITRSAALEYAAKGIRVNAICPSFTETPMIERFCARQDAPADVVKAAIVAQHPIGRLGRPEEMGRYVAFLCSDEVPFMTGSNNYADGAFLTH